MPISSDENLCLLEKKRTIPLESSRLYLKSGLFVLDTLILDNLPDDVASDKNGRRITVDFEDLLFADVRSWNAPSLNYIRLVARSSLPYYQLKNVDLIPSCSDLSPDYLSFIITFPM